MTSNSSTIERKAIDISGRLGSLYDASYDKLVGQNSVETSNVEEPKRCSVCKVFSGRQSMDLNTYLKEIEFDNALRQSILFGMVTPLGVTSVINYNQPIHENIRFLYYSYRSKEEELIFTPGKADQIISPPPFSTRATHMITKILWGFEILCVIPIPDHQSAKTVDSLLQNISIQLKNNEKNFFLTDGEAQQISQLINVTIYGSETCVDNPNTPLLTVLNSLKHWQTHENFHHPLTYIMCSLRYLYNNDQFSETYCLPDETNSDIANIQTTIKQTDKSIKDLARLFEEITENFSNHTSDQQWTYYKEQFCTLLDTFKMFRDRLRRTLADVRQKFCESVEIDNIISDQHYLSLKTDLEMFHQNVYRWFTKTMLLERLNNDQIQYINTSDIPSRGHTFMTIADIDAALKCSLTKEDSSVILWYSNDQLQREKTNEWEQVYQRLTSEQEKAKEQTSLIYVDFSQCQQKLEDFIVTRLPMQTSSESQSNHSKGRHLSSGSQEQPPLTPSPPLQRSSPSIIEINVLLLGETGVGKSTFINAFVNYLIFDTIEKAEQSEPVVLIPVSFLTTIGDQFDEFIVKFGNVDPNENHEHQGQSVTQQCKSYVFDLNNELRLRLIDTPGMGDTRGVAQDDKNIHHILTYVNNLSHLNAICLLLKPNTSRLNVFFRSCINQLLTYLTPISYSNIIFCFTNARSTFFAPGNTGPLLRQMLKQEHLDDIPFQKTNTFCFDSESFRYLAARKCGVNFDEFQKQECINSWVTSVAESVRLLNFILTRERYNLNEWQSPRKLALEISMLARPLLETLRLILYNWILSEVRLTEKEMIMNTNLVTIEICSNCAQNNIVKVGPFQIIEYESVKNNTVNDCSCPFDERHFLIESTVNHGFASQPIDRSTDELKTSFHNFLFKCDRLTHYLREKEVSNQDDLFKPVLDRFLEEERQISQNTNINLSMNKRVKDILRSLKQIRQQNRQQLLESNEKLSLKDVYNIIDELKTIRAVNQQLESIKTGRKLKMEANEYRLKIPLIKNKTFAELTNSLR